jgi:hypothetical protein
MHPDRLSCPRLLCSPWSNVKNGEIYTAFDYSFQNHVQSTIAPVAPNRPLYATTERSFLPSSPPQSSSRDPTRTGISSDIFNVTNL